MSVPGRLKQLRSVHRHVLFAQASSDPCSKALHRFIVWEQHREPDILLLPRNTPFDGAIQGPMGDSRGCLVLASSMSVRKRCQGADVDSHVLESKSRSRHPGSVIEVTRITSKLRRADDSLWSPRTALSKDALVLSCGGNDSAAYRACVSSRGNATDYSAGIWQAV